VLLKQTVGQRITSLRQNEVASGANNATSELPPLPKKDGSGRNNQRQCQNCSKKANNRMKVAKSHDTSNCFYGDRPGWDRQGTAATANTAEDSGNKSATDYFSSKLVYDTGATPKSFVKDMPSKFTSAKGNVSTANGSLTSILGQGKIKFGKIEVDATYVSSFSNNLVSGIDIMKHSIQTVIGNDKIIMASSIIVPEKL
jgi:hypothetical protein